MLIISLAPCRHPSGKTPEFTPSGRNRGIQPYYRCSTRDEASGVDPGSWYVDLSRNAYHCIKILLASARILELRQSYVPPPRRVASASLSQTPVITQPQAPELPVVSGAAGEIRLSPH